MRGGGGRTRTNFCKRTGTHAGPMHPLPLSPLACCDVLSTWPLDDGGGQHAEGEVLLVQPDGEPAVKLELELRLHASAAAASMQCTFCCTARNVEVHVDGSYLATSRGAGAPSTAPHGLHAHDLQLPPGTRTARLRLLSLGPPKAGSGSRASCRLHGFSCSSSAVGSGAPASEADPAPQLSQAGMLRALLQSVGQQGGAEQAQHALHWPRVLCAPRCLACRPVPPTPAPATRR